MFKAFDYAAENPPVSEDQLKLLLRWLSKNGFPDTEISVEYTDFLRESNGGDFVINGREFQMFSAEEIPEFYEAYMFSVYMPFALPFAMDGCGNFYVFNKREHDDGVYIVASGNMSWGNDECFLLAEDFGACMRGKFNFA